MPTFKELQPETYYLIREQSGDELKIVSVLGHEQGRKKQLDQEGKE